MHTDSEEHFSFPKDEEDLLVPLNARPLPKNRKAVALEWRDYKNTPEISATGTGVLADRILQIAYENHIPVRSDSDLVEILGQLDIDSPIPTEAFEVVAHILEVLYQNLAKKPQT